MDGIGVDDEWRNTGKGGKVEWGEGSGDFDFCTRADWDSSGDVDLKGLGLEKEVFEGQIAGDIDGYLDGDAAVFFSVMWIPTKCSEWTFHDHFIWSPFRLDALGQRAVVSIYFGFNPDAFLAGWAVG